VQGFGCRPLEGRRRVFGGRRPKASKGGNRAGGNVERCRVRYGDLGAAGEMCDLDRDEATSCASVKRLTNERRMASNSISYPTICDGWRMSGRALPWPVERQRAGRTDLPDCDAVMECRTLLRAIASAALLVAAAYRASGLVR
jgi:hypothetical protein